MRDRKGRCLLGKGQRKFPDENDGRIHKNGKRAVLKFASDIAADPGIRTEEGPVAFGPGARYIGEHRQDRQFIIVVPKNERIMPEKDEGECDDEQSGREGAEEMIAPAVRSDS